MDKFPEAFARFEKSEIDLNEIRDSNDLIRKFRYWNNVHATTHQQDISLKKIARERGIRIVGAKGISERKGITRKEAKKKYTTIKVNRDIKGRFARGGKKLVVVVRDSRGRFTKK